MMQTPEWRLALHSQLTDHEFVQDEEDILGGCKTCWSNILDGGENYD